MSDARANDTFRSLESGDLRWLVFLAILAAVIRYLAWHLPGLIIEDEGAHYARVGESLAAGLGYAGLDGELQLIYPPVYPGLIAAGVSVGLDAETAGRAISLLFGSLTPVLFFLVGRRMYGERTGWVTGFLAALHPLLVTASVNVLSESTFLFLLLAGFYQLLGLVRTPAIGRAALAGITLGGAYLCRPEAMMITAIWTACFLAARWTLDRLSILSAATLLAGLLLAASPYVAFLHSTTGQWRIEAKTPEASMYHEGIAAGKSKAEIFWGIDERLEGTGVSTASDLAHVRLGTRPLLERLKSAYWQALDNLPALATAIQDPQFGGVFIVLAIGLGLFGRNWGDDRWKSELPLLAMLAFSTFTYLVWPFIRDRTLFSLILPMTLWAGAGLVHLQSWAEASAKASGWGARSTSAVSVAFAMVFGLLLAGTSTIGVSQSDEMSAPWRADRTTRDVGRWLAVASPKSRVADVTPTATFYAGGTMVRLPATDSATALRYLRRHRVDWVVLEHARLANRTYLRDWYDGLAGHALQPTRSFPARSGEVRVFRVDPASIPE